MKPAVPQVVHDQEEACQEDETEQAYSSLDSSPYRQHHQVQTNLLSLLFSICLKEYVAVIVDLLGQG